MCHGKRALTCTMINGPYHMSWNADQVYALIMLYHAVYDISMYIT